MKCRCSYSKGRRYDEDACRNPVGGFRSINLHLYTVLGIRIYIYAHTFVQRAQQKKSCNHAHTHTYGPMHAPTMLSTCNPRSKCELGKFLGSGSYGDVYQIKGEVGRVVKCIKTPYTKRGFATVSMLREIRALNEFCHVPHCMHALFLLIGETDVWIGMEEMRCSLDVVLPLPRVVSQRILWQLAEALRHIHRLGYIHRDVKPSNILLDRSDNAKLSDFDQTRKMATGGRCMTFGAGTLRYCAIEDIARWGECSFEMDVWSLACTYFEMRTKAYAFPLIGSMRACGNSWEQLLSIVSHSPENVPSDGTWPGICACEGFVAEMPKAKVSSLVDRFRARAFNPLDMQATDSQLTDEISSLLLPMLVLYPKKRMSIAQVLEHLERDFHERCLKRKRISVQNEVASEELELQKVFPEIDNVDDTCLTDETSSSSNGYDSVSATAPPNHMG